MPQSVYRNNGCADILVMPHQKNTGSSLGSPFNSVGKCTVNCQLNWTLRTEDAFLVATSSLSFSLALLAIVAESNDRKESAGALLDGIAFVFGARRTSYCSGYGDELNQLS